MLKRDFAAHRRWGRRCLFGLIVGLTPSAAPAKTFTVCTVEIPDAMTEDGVGPQPLRRFYDDVVAAVGMQSGHEFELMFAPSPRCLALFNRNEVDIVWPFIVIDEGRPFDEWGYAVQPVHAMPIIMGGYYVFTREGAPRFNDAASLDGKAVAVARGYGVPRELFGDDRVEKVETNSNELVPKMIRAGRVDAGIIQTGWVPILERKGLLDGLQHGDIIEFWGGSFTFHPTHEGIALANSFSNVILELVVNGRYRELLTGAPYAIPTY